MSGTPKVTFVGITPAELASINDLRNHARCDGELNVFPADFHPQRRETRPRSGDLIAAIDGRYFVRSGGSLVHLRFVMPEMKGGPQLEARAFSSREHAVR